MMNKETLHILGIILSLTLIVLYGVAVPSPRYYLHIVIMAIIWSIVSLSLNQVYGYTGLLNLGQAGIVGIGSYTSGILALRTGIPVWYAIPIAGVATALFGIVIGLISLRTREMIFTIVTLMVGIALYVTFQSWEEVTGGYLGLKDIPRPGAIQLPFLTVDFRSIHAWYFLIMIIFLLTTLFLYKLANSRIGRIFLSIRDDEGLATAMGVDIRKYKILSFTISCFFAGIAGSFYAHYLTFVCPESFKFTASFEAVIYTLFGGAGTILGPIIGTFSLRMLFEYFHPLMEYRLIVCGIIILLILKFMPEGIYVLIKEKFKKRIP